MHQRLRSFALMNGTGRLGLGEWQVQMRAKAKPQATTINSQVMARLNAVESMTVGGVMEYDKLLKQSPLAT